jgi:hypothetical protein
MFGIHSETNQTKPFSLPIDSPALSLIPSPSLQTTATTGFISRSTVDQVHVYILSIIFHLKESRVIHTGHGDLALDLLDRMLELSVWFYSNEIDKATSAFDDFRGILNLSSTAAAAP